MTDLLYLFKNYAVANYRLDIDALIILTFVEEMELIHAFIIHVFAIYTFSKNEVANDRLVIDAVIMLTMKEEIELIDAFVIHMFAIYAF